MPSVITAPVLGAVNNGLSLVYNSQLYRAPSVQEQFVYQATSTGRDEVYPSLDMMRGPREWLGSRIAQQLSAHQFTIKNRKFEQTIAIKRDDIEDDKVGLYTPIAQEMGNAANSFPDVLIASLMPSGATTAGYDGQNYFDTAHPNYAADGSAATVANYTSGSNPGWYLIDNSRALKPFIFQKRIPFELVARFALTDPSVFDNDEFLWGDRGRMNAGFGLWQLCYYSKAAFTVANIEAARATMATYRRPDGVPMGISPDTVVVPSTLFTQAKSYYENGLIANDPTSPTVLVENRIRGMFKPIEFKFLN